MPERFTVLSLVPSNLSFAAIERFIAAWNDRCRAVHLDQGPRDGCGEVDDVGGADRADEFDVAGAAHAGDLRTRRGRDLDGEAAQ
ncbi:hypothetical protein [Geodermatophilus amargosae]|uniref:hypothetical protein n=1 Tax=Geodermatophilus amargosae TaxID=1296565 RepID=UPI0015871AF6|nr:hypothetical protein [Geodermatophilus amargosae]